MSTDRPVDRDIVTEWNKAIKKNKTLLHASTWINLKINTE